MARNIAMLHLLEIDDMQKSQKYTENMQKSQWREFTVNMQKSQKFGVCANVFFAEHTRIERICGKYQGSVQISRVLNR